MHVAPATSFVRVEFKVSGADLRVLSLPLRFRHAGSDLNQDQLMADYYTTRLFWAVCVKMKRYGCSQKAGGEIRPKGLFSQLLLQTARQQAAVVPNVQTLFTRFAGKTGFLG